jgi:uncharacterized sulfatase
MLAAAGLQSSDAMPGRSLLDVLESGKSGLVDAGRDAIAAGRERHSSARYDNLGYPSRVLRTREYLYIRNFHPERWPGGDPAGFERDPFGYYDIDGGPSKTFLVEQRDSPDVSRYFHLAVAKRPPEELYDARSDPGNVENLADDPQQADVLTELRTRLEKILRETGDPRVLGGGEVFETYPRYSRVRTFPTPDDSSRN